MDEAKQAIAGYCFGRARVEWSRPPSVVIGEPPRATTRAVFAYRSYDCLPRSAGPGLSLSDVLVAEGLNARMGSRPLLHVEALLPAVSSAVRAIPPDLSFWDLSSPEILEPQSEGDRGYGLRRAWYLLMSVPDIDVARTHKILHHARPKVFPLLDNLTLQFLREGQAWGNIHENLTDQADAFIELEQWFGGLLQSGDAPLLRLRLHDILLWLHARDEGAAARSLGEEVLRERAAR